MSSNPLYVFFYIKRFTSSVKRYEKPQILQIRREAAKNLYFLRGPASIRVGATQSKQNLFFCNKKRRKQIFNYLKHNENKLEAWKA